MHPVTSGILLLILTCALLPLGGGVARAQESAAENSPNGDGAKKLNSVVAIVNHHGISRLEIEKLQEQILQQSTDREGEVLSEEEAQKQALESLIFRELQLQRAHQLGLEIPQEMLKKRVSEYQQQFQAADEGELRAIVRRQLGLNWNDFHRRLREDMEIEAVFYREVFSKTDVYDEEVENFLQNESGLVGQREYRLRHLRIDGRDEQARDAIAELRRRIVEDGEAFADLAREFSSGDNAAAGGDLEWRSAAQLPAPFLADVQHLSPGEVGDIIETGRGFHLLQLTDVRGGIIEEGLQRLRLAHIFLPAEEAELAEHLSERLADGGDFSRLAAQYSQDERSADKGGDMGWFPAGTLPEYFEPVKELQAGEISQPITSPFGIHLVRVDQRDELDLSAAREQVRSTLRERRALAQRLDWLNQLKNRAYIIIVDPAFGNLIES